MLPGEGRIGDIGEFSGEYPPRREFATYFTTLPGAILSSRTSLRGTQRVRSFQHSVITIPRAPNRASSRTSCRSHPACNF